MSDVGEEVQRTYDEFWKPIIERPDGSIDLEKLKLELYDFSQVMAEVPKVYCYVTGGKVSKVTTLASVVNALADEHYESVLADDAGEGGEEHY